MVRVIAETWPTTRVTGVTHAGSERQIDRAAPCSEKSRFARWLSPGPRRWSRLRRHRPRALVPAAFVFLAEGVRNELLGRGTLPARQRASV